MFVQDMLSNEHAENPMTQEEIQHEIKTLTYRHIAWMTALRHAMRMLKPWETTVLHKTNQEWDIGPPERESTVEEDLKPYLSDSDLKYVLDKGNKQTAILYQQSHHLRELKEKGIISDAEFDKMKAKLIKEF